MLQPQALAYLCPNLKSINGEEFDVEVTEETAKIAQAAKQELAGLVCFCPHYFNFTVSPYSPLYVENFRLPFRSIQNGRMIW